MARARDLSLEEWCAEEGAGVDDPSESVLRDMISSYWRVLDASTLAGTA
jgi:hypothetical protein